MSEYSHSARAIALPKKGGRPKHGHPLTSEKVLRARSLLIHVASNGDGLGTPPDRSNRWASIVVVVTAARSLGPAHALAVRASPIKPPCSAIVRNPPRLPLGPPWPGGHGSVATARRWNV
jgi:hypothetical protein